jgi:hypothetical protein
MTTALQGAHLTNSRRSCNASRDRGNAGEYDDSVKVGPQKLPQFDAETIREHGEPFTETCLAELLYAAIDRLAGN